MTFDPSIRPTAHFVPQRGWMNDPNGLIFHGGLYHLFFQHDPESLTSGRPSWGHATSPDLTSWTEQPMALARRQSEYVYSGSVVLDRDNSSGLGTASRPPLVAVYTSHEPVTGRESQSLAASLDGGTSWTPYADNPVLDIASTDFRDPRVLWHGGRWLMVVALAEERVVRFYGSGDLISWEQTSEFGPAGCVEGVWECPDLLPVPIEDSDVSRFVLLVSVQAGAPAGGSGTQYFVGDLVDGAFHAETEARWVDHGSDFYAGISYADEPSGDRTIQGWMSNWLYAENVPATEFRGSMSVPRRITLRRLDGELVLVQHPVVPPPTASRTVRDLDVDGTVDVSQGDTALHLVAELEPRQARRVGIEVRAGATECTVITIDTVAWTLTLDRSRSGRVDLHPGFAAAHVAPLLMRGDVVQLEVVVDVASVEVLSGGGTVFLTDQVFPSPTSTGVRVFSEGGTARVRFLTIHTLGRTSEAEIPR